MKMFLNLLSYFFVIVFLSIDVHTQVCEDFKIITRMEQETYKVSHRITYGGQCSNGTAIYWCRLSRWKIEDKQRNVLVSSSKFVRECCDGYRREDNSSDISNITCNPICEPACVNGYCNYPGNCECNAGYTKDKQNNHTCIPSCEKGCGNGTCIAPNTCRCDQGYELVNETCQPICMDPFGFQNCNTTLKEETTRPTSEMKTTTKSNETSIISLFETTTNHDTIRNCGVNPCGNGTCLSSFECQCFYGYHIDFNRLWGYVNGIVCVPYCSDCAGSDCIAPNKCVENEVFTTIHNVTMRPIILSEKNTTTNLNATSVFESTTNDETMRNCDLNPCGNGTCLSSYECQCFDGYKIDYSRLWAYVNGTVCVPYCSDCAGSDCIAPNTCVESQLPSTLPQDLDDEFQDRNKTIRRNITSTTSTTNTTTTTPVSFSTKPRSMEKSRVHQKISIMISILLPTCWNYNVTCSTDNSN